MFKLIPIATEKSTALGTMKKHAFYAPKEMTKIQIKQAVHELYGVRVTTVRTLKSREKLRGALTKRPGVKRPERKKVIITLDTDKPLDFTKLKKEK